jgi:chromosome segregation ATPase
MIYTVIRQLQKKAIPVQQSCRVLSVSRSGFYEAQRQYANHAEAKAGWRRNCKKMLMVSYEQQTRVRQVEQKLEQLHAVEQRNKLLAAQIDEKDTRIQDLQAQIGDLTQQASVFTEQLHQRQMELVSLQAKLDTHTALSIELRSYLGRESAPK